MIIDCHGHYTTAPAAHQRFREAQIAHFKDASAPPATSAQISDDEIRESIETNQLKLQKERGGDLTLFSPRASAMGHHIGNEEVSSAWTRANNDLMQARRRSVPGQLRRRLSAPAVTGSADRQFRARARALRAGAGVRRLQPEPGSVGRTLELAAAHRPALVSALREDGRARRARDGARLGVLQPVLSRDRRPLHQRRHHGVHAVHPGGPVPRLPDPEVHHSARRRRGRRITGAAIAGLPTC